MLSAAWLFQRFPYCHCLLSSLPQPSYWGIGTILPTPWDLQSRHLVLLRMGEGDSRGISRIYGLYKSAHPYPCISSPSLIFFQSINVLIQTRSYYKGVAQTQKEKDSPYLVDFMVEDLLCQALNQAYMLQGMQVSISSLGVGEASHRTWEGLASK